MKNLVQKIVYGVQQFRKSALNPKPPEGVEVFALNLFKASAAPDEGSKENIKWRKNMRRSKGMQLGAMLVAMLLLSMALVPAVNAKADNGKQNLSDPAVVKALLDKFIKEGPNAEKFFAKLSPEEQTALREALKVSRIETNVSVVNMNKGDVSIATITCNSPRVEVAAYSYLGNKIWSYIQQIDRCYDGSEITEASRIRQAATYLPTWTFAEHIDSTESGGAGYSSYRSYTQGLFKNCILGICGEENYPYIDMVVYGDGGYWHNEDY